MTHTLDIRIYYEDTDAGGVVYHANYLKFSERARTEWLRKLGFENAALTKEKSMVFVVRHMDVDYIKPVRLDDLVQVRTHVKEIRNTSFTMQQDVYRGEICVCKMTVVLVAVDVNTFKPVRLPNDIKHVLEG